MKEQKKQNNLFLWSMTCMLSYTALNNLTTSAWVQENIPQGIQMLFPFLLLLLPGLGVVLGVMSLRKEGHSRLTIVFIVFNIVLVLLQLVFLFLSFSAG
jgi:hypothetical protein